MKLLHSLLWLFLMSSLLMMLLQTSSVEAADPQLYIYISSWDGSTWTTPVNATKIDYANATWGSFQRKLFKAKNDNYFATFFNLTAHNIQYVASSDLTTWTSAKNYSIYGWSKFPLGYYDIGLTNRASVNASLFFTGSTTDSTWVNMSISGLTMIRAKANGLGGQLRANGIKFTPSLTGAYELAIFHRNTTIGYSLLRLHQTPSNQYESSQSVPFGDPDIAGHSGGNTIVNYKTSSPYHMMVLCKGNDRKLYWSIVNATTLEFKTDPLANLGVTLGVGFNDFCATSEAQAIGDPERVHLVFGNSTGLFYMKYESDAWSSVTSLGVTGTSPTIAVDDDGKLVLTYVASNLIYYMTKTTIGSWSSSSVLGEGYFNAGYLSSSQNEQDGEILLEWTANYQKPNSVMAFKVKSQDGLATANATITSVTATQRGVKFRINGTGIAFLNIAFPRVNRTQLSVYVNGDLRTTTITANATHYFIYLELHLSSPSIVIMYDPPDYAYWFSGTKPIIYGAITLWSIAMIIGIGIVFMKSGDLSALPFVIVIGLGILICLLISLTVLSSFLRL